MDETIASLARAVAAAFDLKVQQQVERLIRDGEAEPVHQFGANTAHSVAIAGLIVATVSMTCNVLNTLRQSGAQPTPAVVERQVIIQIVPPRGVSDQTLSKIVRTAVAKALDH